MSDDDDLRFGDVQGSNDESDDPIMEVFTRAIVAIIMLYVILYLLQALFEIPIPFI